MPRRHGRASSVTTFDSGLPKKDTKAYNGCGSRWNGWYGSQYDDLDDYQPPAYAKKNVGSEEVFTSDLVYSEVIQVRIHELLEQVCKELAIKLPGKEFSIVARGAMVGGSFIIGKEFAIPMQEVDYGSVDYNQEELIALKSEGFNVLIHSHPAGVKNFSATDMNTINVHFDCSILFLSGEFVESIVPIRVSDDFILQARGDVDTYSSTSVTITDEMMSKIKVHSNVVYYGTTGKKPDAPKTAIVTTPVKSNSTYYAKRHDKGREVIASCADDNLIGTLEVDGVIYEVYIEDFYAYIDEVISLDTCLATVTNDGIKVPVELYQDLVDGMDPDVTVII